MQANRKLRAPRGGRVSARRTPGGAAPRWPRASVGLQFACQRISASSWWDRPRVHYSSLHACAADWQIFKLMDESGDISKSGLREALNTASSANLNSMDQHGEIGSIFEFFKIQGIPLIGYFFLVQCTCSCCISTCTVVNFPCKSQKCIWSNDLPLPI